MIGGQGEGRVAPEFALKPGKMPDSGVQVLLGIKGIAYIIAVRDNLHDLHESHGAGYRNGIGIEVRLHLDNAFYNQGVDFFPSGYFFYEVIEPVAQDYFSPAPGRQGFVVVFDGSVAQYPAVD